MNGVRARQTFTWHQGFQIMFIGFRRTSDGNPYKAPIWHLSDMSYLTLQYPNQHSLLYDPKQLSFHRTNRSGLLRAVIGLGGIMLEDRMLRD